MRLLQIIGFGIFLFIVPVLLGSLFVRKEEAYTLPTAFAVGFAVLFATLHWPAVLCILTHQTLSTLTAIWYGLLVVLLLLSLVKLVRRRAHPLQSLKAYFKGMTFPELLASAAVIAHAVVTAVYMYVDDDDYAFVANATTSLDTNTLLKYLGGTGKVLTTYADDGIDRLVSSPHFTFFAAVSKLFGTRPAALAHTYLPPVLTLAFFAAFFAVGYELFAHDRRKTGIFGLFVFAASVFSYTSPYTAGTFLLIRSWQGKAQIVGLILPLLLWFYLSMGKEHAAPRMALLTVLLTASCLMTSMGAMLAAGFTVVLSLVAAGLTGERRVFLASLPPLIMPLITALIYLKVR